jgi:hypothetical protein
VQAVGGEEGVVVGCGGCDAEPIGESHDAAPAIATHHPAAAIWIIEFHPEIRIPIIQYHQPICPVLPAKLPYVLRLAEPTHIDAPAIQNDKVIPGSGHLV